MSKLSAKKFLSDKGYGSGTNYTTGAVSVLMEQFATARLEAYKEELVNWLENQKNNAKDLCEEMDNEHCTEGAIHYDGQYAAYGKSINHLTKKETDESK